MCCNKLIQLLGAGKQSACFEQSNVAKENGREFRINTQSKLCRVKNDGCLNNSNNENKCDFFFKICDTEEIILVELKGTDVVKAVTQIIATYNKLQPLLKSESAAYRAFVVSSSVPTSAEQNFRRLKEKCKKS